MGGLITKPAPVLGDLITLIRSAAKALKHDRPPLTEITMGMIKGQGKPPKCKCKASESRALLPVVSHMLRHYFPAQNDYEERRLQCVLAMEQVYHIMYNWNTVVDPGPRLATAARKHCLLYSEISQSWLVHLQHSIQ